MLIFSLDQLESIGVFYMVTKSGKYILVGVFIQVIQQDSTIKKEAARIVGNYNLKYKYSSDYDYFYRMIIKKKLIGTKK